MPKQPTDPGLYKAIRNEHARQATWLAGMAAGAAWTRLMMLAAPRDPKAVVQRRSPVPLGRRCGPASPQSGWRAPSGPTAGEMPGDSGTIHHVAGIGLCSVPDDHTPLLAIRSRHVTRLGQSVSRPTKASCMRRSPPSATDLGQSIGRFARIAAVDGPGTRIGTPITGTRQSRSGRSDDPRRERRRSRDFDLRRSRICPPFKPSSSL